MAKISGLLSALAILPALHSGAQAQEPLSAKQASDLNNIHAILQVCDVFQMANIPQPAEEIKTDFTQFCEDTDELYDTLEETSYAQIEETYKAARETAQDVYEAAREEAGDVYEAARKASQEVYEDNREADSTAAYRVREATNLEAYRVQETSNLEAYRTSEATNLAAYRSREAGRTAAFNEYLLDAANLYAERFPNGLQITIAPKTDGSVFKGPAAP